MVRIGRRAAPRPLQRRRDLADGRLGPRRVDGQREQVPRRIVRCLGNGGQRGIDGGLVAFGPQALQLGDLGRADTGVVDLEHVDRFVLATRYLFTPITAAGRSRSGPGAGGGLLDAQLGNAGVDRLCHPASRLDLGDVAPRAPGQVVGEPFERNCCRPTDRSPWWCRIPVAATTACYARSARESVGSAKCLVQRVGVQGLVCCGQPEVDT